MGAYTGDSGGAAGDETEGGTPMPHRSSARARTLARLGAATLAIGALEACAVGRQPATASPTTTGHATFPVTVKAPPSTTVIGIALPTPPGVITDDDQTVSEQLDEAMGELMIDFADAPASASPATCEVFGIQPRTDQYAVAATITNTDGVTSTYRLSYELFGPDGASLGTDFTIVSAVEPGTTVRDDTLGYLSDPVPWDQVTCTVIQVLRLDAA